MHGSAKQVVAGSGGGGEGRHVRPRARLRRGMGTIQGKRSHSPGRMTFHFLNHSGWLNGILHLESVLILSRSLSSISQATYRVFKFVMQIRLFGPPTQLITSFSLGESRPVYK